MALLSDIPTGTTMILRSTRKFAENLTNITNALDSVNETRQVAYCKVPDGKPKGIRNDIDLPRTMLT